MKGGPLAPQNQLLCIWGSSTLNGSSFRTRKTLISNLCCLLLTRVLKAIFYCFKQHSSKSNDTAGVNLNRPFRSVGSVFSVEGGGLAAWATFSSPYQPDLACTPDIPKLTAATKILVDQACIIHPPIRTDSIFFSIFCVKYILNVGRLITNKLQHGLR